MGILNIRIDDELDETFRLEVVKKLHSKKGALRLAVEEAIKLWLKEKGMEMTEK